MEALLRLLPSHRVALGSAVWLGIASALAALALAEAGARLVQSAVAGVLSGEAWAAVATLGAARVGLSWAQSVVAHRLGHRLATELRAILVRRALALDPSVAPPPAELATRVSHDVTVLQALVAFRLPSALADALTAGALAAWALWLDARVLATALLPVALALPLVVLVARRSARAHDDARAGYGRVVEAVSDTLAGALVLRQHGATDDAERRVGDLLERFEADALRARSLGALGAPLLQGAALAAFLGAASVVAARIRAGALDVGAAIAIIAALSLAARPAARLAASATEASTFLASARRVAALLGLPAHASAAAAHAPPPLTSAIRARGLVVRRGPRTVLDGADLEIVRGERLALVGANGAGKTTLVLSLLGLVDHEGRIDVDGVEVPGCASLLAWVPQEPLLFEGTVGSNVALGVALDPVRAARALERVGASRWVEARGGLDAPIGPGARELSVGERQRLCLARALYRERPVLVLDEPTASLDAESAAALEATLEELLAGGDLTVLVVTHDARLAARCERRVRLEAGRCAPA